VSAPGYIVPEDVVEAALRVELADIDARIEADTIDAYLAELFSNYDQPRRDIIKEWLTERGDFRVIHGFPRTHRECPCYSIVLDPEDEAEFVGETGVNYVDGDGNQRVTKAGFRTGVINVIAHAENVDECKWMYHIAVFALQRQQDTMIDAGFTESHIGGRDLGFDPRFASQEAAAFVYRRAVQIRAQWIQHTDLEPLYEVQELDAVLAEASVTARVAFNDP
jgi:hypothetical protein